jgi:hypothetical protein
MPTNLITLENAYYDGFSLSWAAVSGAVKYHINLNGRGPWATSSYNYEITDTNIEARLADWENVFSIIVSSEDANGNISPIGSSSLCRTLVDHGAIIISEDGLDYLGNWLNLSEASSYTGIQLSAKGCANINLPSFGSGVTKFAVVIAEGTGYNAIPYVRTEDECLFVSFPLLANKTVDFQIIPFIS